jgi:hypothetical protein
MKRLALYFLLASVACKNTPDPLAAERATCAQLAERKQLKSGLSIDDCALQLKASAPVPPAPREGAASAGR